MNTNVLLAAHRGYSGRYPENTMCAFREAIGLDIDQMRRTCTWRPTATSSSYTTQIRTA